MCNSCGNPEHKVHDFVHLHNHSCYSLLDGLSDPKVLAARSAELGFPAMALTDHGSCAGLYKFQKACIASKIKPILGIELYITADRHIKEKGVKTNHLLLLAKDAVGLENLYRLSSLAEIEGKYNRKPRVDFDLLTKYNTGLICTTGCCVSEVPDAFVKGEDENAEKIFCKYKELFKDDYYVEIMLHKYFNNKEQENKERFLAKKLYELAKKHNVKAIATNDVHYAKKEQAKYHDILLSMQTGDTIKNPERFTFDSDEFYIKSYEEMLAVFGKAPELLLNTMEIAEKISPNLISPGKDLLPIFSVPGGFKDETDYLKNLVKDGMLKKGLINKQNYRDRIKYEMEAIIKCGYTRYFLILWDMINFARSNGIAISAGRGCFVPDSVVKTLEGDKKIKDILVGDKVLSYDGKFHDVLDTLVYDIEEEIIDIELEDGRKISCTHDHEIHVVLEDGTLVWKKASELTETDEVFDIKPFDTKM